MSDDLDFLHPCFLGPSAENAGLFEELLVELVRDHSFWRRNFHPEDGPSVPASAPYQPEYMEFVSRMKTELYALSAELKRALNPAGLGRRRFFRVRTDASPSHLIARIEAPEEPAGRSPGPSSRSSSTWSPAATASTSGG